MKLLLVNTTRYQHALQQQGHEVLSLGDGEGFDLRRDGERLRISDGVAALGGEVDGVIVQLFGMTPLPLDLVACPHPLVARVVDSTLNHYWLRHLLTLFHIAFVDQRASVEPLKAEGVNARWLPLSVPAGPYRNLERPPEPAREIVLVGRIGEHRPKRQGLVDHLREQGLPVVVAGGEGEQWLSPREAALRYSRAAVGLNENLFDGFTLRALEVMASGTLLLTEEGEQGAGTLFAPGEHFVPFRPAEAADLAARWLEASGERERIAAAGREAVLAEHTHDRRAEVLAEAVEQLAGDPPARPPLGERLLAEARALERVSLVWPRWAADLPRRGVEAAGRALAEGAPRAQAAQVIGRILGQWKNLDEALPHLTIALELKPRSLDRYLDLASLFERAGRQGEARRTLRTALRYCNHLEAERKEALARLLEGEGALEGELFTAFGDELAGRGRTLQLGFGHHVPERLPLHALAWYRRGRERGDPVAAQRLALLLEGEGLHAHAADAWLDALELLGPDPARLLHAGLAALRTYRRREGLRLLEQALSRDPSLANRIPEEELSEKEREELGSGTAAPE